MPPPDGEEHGTRVLDRPVPGPEQDTGPQAIITQPNLARSSQVMALGTVASRGTGFLRTLVLVAALGAGTLADAYNNSNTLPNTVYYLMLGGIFTSVVVPMLVRAAKEDPDRGVGYAERIFTLGVISLLIITVAGMVLAGPLVDLYAGNISDPREHTVMVLLAARRDPERPRPVRPQHVDAGHQQRRGDPGRSAVHRHHRDRQERGQRLDPRYLPARDRHDGWHRDSVDHAVPHTPARRVQHAASLGPAAT
jgi:hypothetical protein